MSNAVEPIRDQRKLAAVKSLLKSEAHPRDYLLFVLGVNFGLRIGDLLQLRVGDVLDRQYEVRQSFIIRESKTKKERRITINSSARDAIEFYFSKVGFPESDAFLFKSLRSDRALDSVQAWRMIKSWCNAVGVKDRVGTHTLRKTWGYHARKRGVPIELIQAKFGHSSPSVTRRYLGITADEVAEVENAVCI